MFVQVVNVNRFQMNQGWASMQRQEKRKGSEVDRNSSRGRDARLVSIALSSPADGRPAVVWAHGSTPGRIIEFWPDKEQIGRAHRFSFDAIRKYVVYDKTIPEIRAVLLVDKVMEKDGEVIPPILGRRLEWDGPQGKAAIKKALGLVDEIARVERRGRPRGSGRPKLKLAYTDGDKQLYNRLKKAKCTYVQIKTVFSLARHDNIQVKAAKELGISPQAVSKRIKVIKSKVRREP